MKRNPVEITQASFVHVVKCKIRELLKSPGLNFLQRMPLEMALKDGGPVEQIAEMMWLERLHVTVDSDDAKHKMWIDNGVVEIAEQSKI